MCSSDLLESFKSLYNQITKKLAEIVKKIEADRSGLAPHGAASTDGRGLLSNLLRSSRTSNFPDLLPLLIKSDFSLPH